MRIDDVGNVDTVLMLFGDTGFCADCGEETLFVPVDGAPDERCCTSCDGAVVLLRPAGAAEHGGRRAS